MIEKIKHNLPLFSIVWILIGGIHESMYYSYFGINILSYLNLPQLLILFLNSILPILFGIAIAISSSWLLIYSLKNMNKYKYGAFILLVGIGSLLIGYFLVSFKNYFVNLLSISFFFSLALIFSYVLAPTMYIKKDYSNYSKVMMKYYSIRLYKLRKQFIMFSIIISLIVILFDPAHKAKHLITYEVADFVITHKNFDYTNNSYRIIGKTKDEIFIYDINCQESIILKYSEIDMIKFHKKIDPIIKPETNIFKLFK